MSNKPDPADFLSPEDYESAWLEWMDFLEQQDQLPFVGTPEFDAWCEAHEDERQAILAKYPHIEQPVEPIEDERKDWWKDYTDDEEFPDWEDTSPFAI